MKKLFGNNRSKNGSYSVGMIALVLAVVVVINLIAGQLPESVRNIDISDNRIYEISDVSKELLNELDREIEFTIYAEKTTTDVMIKTFLEKYTDLSDKIQVEWVDPVLHPGELDENGVTEDTILITCETTGKSTAVTFSDILVVDDYTYYMTGSTSPTEFDGEGQLTAAVNYVTSEQSKQIYYTSGHGEGEFSASVNDLLGKNNYAASEVNLLMESEIPEDCDLLFMYAPAKDITEDEKNTISNYLSSGGNVMILLGLTDGETPNLDALLSEYGMNREDGYIADMERCYQGNYYYIFPEIIYTEGITDGLTSDMVLFVDSFGMTVGEAARDTITVEEFMTTSDYGYAVTETEQTEGTYVLGAIATETIDTITDEENSSEDGAEDIDTAGTQSRLTVISTDSIINSDITDAFTTLENLDLFMNAVSANFDDVSNIAIDGKSLEVTYNTMQYTGIISLFSILGIPAIILIFGFTKWWKRRKA